MDKQRCRVGTLVGEVELAFTDEWGSDAIVNVPYRLHYWNRLASYSATIAIRPAYRWAFALCLPGRAWTVYRAHTIDANSQLRPVAEELERRLRLHLFASASVQAKKDEKAFRERHAAYLRGEHVG